MNMLTHPNPFKGDLLEYISLCIKRVDSTGKDENCKARPWELFLLNLNAEDFHQTIKDDKDWYGFYRSSYCNSISYSFFTGGILMSDGTREPKIENLYALVYDLRYMDIKSERNPIL